MNDFRVEQVGASDGQPSRDMLEILSAVRARSPSNPERVPRTLRETDVLAPFAIPRAPGVSIREGTAGDAAGLTVPVRVYRPDGARGLLPTAVFCHGGCFVFGTPAMYDGVCCYLAAAARCAVVSVDYRCAPEHPFPAALEDVYRVVRFLQQDGAELGLDARRLALAGDSAGGNLAAATSLVLRARGDSPPQLQVLLYPITDLSQLQTPSYDEFQDGFLSRELMTWSRDQYVSEAQRRQPWASPLLEPDLSGLPRTLLVSAELDVLRDEGEALAARLAAAHSPVRAVRFNGVEHAFVSMAGALAAGRHALDLAVQELQRSFTG